MSVAVEQFELLIRETLRWLETHTLRRRCRVCEVETLQVTEIHVEWKRFRCVECGYQESFKKEQCG